jgi:hypothetical protein
VARLESGSEVLEQGELGVQLRETSARRSFSAKAVILLRDDLYTSRRRPSGHLLIRDLHACVSGEACGHHLGQLRTAIERLEAPLKEPAAQSGLKKGRGQRPLASRRLMTRLGRHATRQDQASLPSSPPAANAAQPSVGHANPFASRRVSVALRLLPRPGC